MLKLAILGGNFGQKVHIPAFSNIDGLEIKQFDSKDHFSIKDFDIVSIALPPMQSYNFIKECLINNKSVFCEKPLCANLEQALELQILSKNIISAINFEICESKIIKKCRKLILDGYIGQIEYIIFNWKTKNYKNKNHLWKFDVLKGGGVINNLGSHILNLIEYICNKSIIKITGNINPSLNFNTSSNLIIDFDNFSGNIFIDADTNIASNIYCKIIGKNGTLILQNNTEILKNFELILKTNQTLVIDSEKEIINEDGRISLTHSLATKFINGIMNQHIIKPNIDDGVRVRFLIDQLLKSIK